MDAVIAPISISAGCPAGIERIHFDRAGSTSDEALRLAGAGQALPFWVTAGAQSRGRGRRGRRWASPPGNLYASLACAAGQLPPETWRLPLVSAVAVRETVRGLLGAEVPVTIKWPNDVLAGGAKISGILVEQHRVGRTDVVVVGLGVNVRSKPALGAYPTACLADFDVDLAPEAVWRALAVSVQAWIAVWAAPGGFAKVRERWLAHAASLGRTITVGTGQGPVSGIFRTIDQDGHLVLDGDDGRTRRLSVGDIQFGDEVDTHGRC